MPQAASKHAVHRTARFSALIWLLAAGWCAAGTLSLTAIQRNGLALPGAVITLETLSPSLPPAPPAPPVKAVLDQIDLAFVPDVLVVPVNSTVHFPNSDSVSHQVYSFSAAKSFQLPLYRGKPYPPVTFDRAGIVSIGCNIHDDMLAYVVVTEAQHFGRTDAQGRFLAANLPSGQYRARLWHPRLSEPPVEVVVDMSAADASVELPLKRNLRPAPLGGKPRSWDY